MSAPPDFCRVAAAPGLPAGRLDEPGRVPVARRWVTESIATVPGATAEHHGGREHAPGNGS